MSLEFNDHKNESPLAMDEAENKTASADYAETVLTILEILFTSID